MKILVMGSGGVGGWYGARLARAGHAVTFVARGAHLAAIQDQGLIIRSAVEGEWRVDCRALERVEPGETADLVLVCVKSPDTAEAAALVAPAVGPDSVVLSLQNGVDNEEKLQSLLPPCHLMGGVAYIFANIEEPGVIAHHQFGSIVIGDVGGGVSPVAQRIGAAFTGAGIDCRVDADITSVLWQKYVFLVALSGVSAATRQPLGVIREIPETRAVWQRQVDELLALAAAMEITLPHDMAERCASLLESLGPDNFASLYHDLANGKPLELEALHGHAARLAAEHGVPAPTVSTVYGILKAQAPAR